MIPKIVSDFFDVLCEKDAFQEKHIQSMEKDEIDFDGFEKFLNYCVFRR